MNPFIDFNNISRKEVEQITSLMRSESGERPERLQLQPIMDDFMKFVATALRAIQVRLKEKHPDELLPNMSVDYDPKVERERFLKDTWCMQADHWALIETMQTYYLTMMTIIEKIQIPDDRHLMLASIGSGPGLYETYLAKSFGTRGIGGVVTCVDFAEEMTAMQRFIMSLQQPRLCNVEPVTGDMANIPLPDKSQDAILCNNSLQWCTNWRKAISEMARVLDPDRKPWAYLIVHLHKQAMHVRTFTGECPIDMQPILVPQIMDELEKNRFTISSSRQLHGGKGSGQAGGGLDRVFLKAEYTPHGLRHNWRSAQKQMSNPQFLRMNKK